MGDEGTTNGKDARISECERRLGVIEGDIKGIRTDFSTERCKSHAEILLSIRRNIHRMRNHMVPKELLDEMRAMVKAHDEALHAPSLISSKEWEETSEMVKSHEKILAQVKGSVTTLKVLVVLVPLLAGIAAWVGAHTR
jgi:hypothetical protein